MESMNVYSQASFFFVPLAFYLLPTWCDGKKIRLQHKCFTSVWITHSIEWTQVNRMFDTVYFFFLHHRQESNNRIYPYTQTYRRSIDVSFCFIPAARVSLICFQKILPMHGNDCWQKVFVHTWKFDRKFVLQRKNVIETGCNLKCAFVFVQIGFALNYWFYDKYKWKCFWCLRECIN